MKENSLAAFSHPVQFAFSDRLSTTITLCGFTFNELGLFIFCFTMTALKVAVRMFTQLNDADRFANGR